MSRHAVRDLKHKGRRAFLALAGGGILGLPLLEFTHGKAWAGGSTVRRFLTVFEHGGTLVNQGYGSSFYDGGLFDGHSFHHGVDYWKPTSPGEALALGPIMQDLEAVKSKLLVLRGIDNMAAGHQCAYNLGGHGVSNDTALTAAMCEHPDPDTYDATNALGASIDHVLAERLAEKYPVKFKRIHLTVDGHQYGTPYYSGPNQRAYGESSPEAAFNTIFEGVSADEPDPAQVHLQLKRQGVMKGVMTGYNRYKGVVSQSDMHQIDAHLDHLSDLQKELMAPPVQCEPPTGINDPSDMSQGDIVGPLHVKIILAALRCGLTNVANLEIADILTPWAPAGLLMDSGFGIGHSLHHYASDIGDTGAVHSQLDNFVQEMLENRRWRMSLFKALAEGLDDPAFMEGDKTMLDNSLMLMTSEFSSGAMHSSAGIPMLLAGSAGGYFNTGRHLNYNKFASTETSSFDYETNESTHNVFTSVLQAFGGDDETFGSQAEHAKHSGPLPNLT